MSANNGLAPEAASAPAEARKAVAYRWYVLGLFFLISIVNMMDRTIVPALAEPLKAEFHLSDSQFGFLAGFAYAVTYIVCGIPIGLLMDRVNRAKMLACLVSFWGVACMMMGAVNSFGGLVATRMAVAGAESGGNPTSISLISDYFPPEKRSSAIGIFFSAHGVATFAAFTFAAWIGAHYGWRIAFVCVGLPGLILGVVTFFTLREPPRGAFDAPVATPQVKPRPASFVEIVKTMIANPTIRYVVIGGVLTVLGAAGISAFTASYFYRVHGLTLVQAGLVTGLVLGVGTSLGAIVGGFASDQAIKKSVSGACYVAAGAMLLAAPSAVAGFMSTSLYVSMALIFLYKVLYGTYFGATFSTVTRAAPTRVRGASVSFLNVMLNLVGAGAGPLVAGVLSDRFAAAGHVDPLKLSLAVLASIFLLASVFYVLAGRSLKAQIAPA